MNVTLANEEIELLPEKAFYWKKESLLGFSDVHLGKAESLQSYGIPVPSGSHHEDLKKISNLIEKTNAKKIVILGDFIHQKNSWTAELLNDLKLFFKAHDHVEWILLIGNHERGSISQLQQLPFHIVENDLNIGPFLLTHGHTQDAAAKNFQIQGHVHPVVKLEQGSTRLRLPCFVVCENSLTLPSFGSLTGGYEMKPNPKQKVYAVTSSSVFFVPK